MVRWLLYACWLGLCLACGRPVRADEGGWQWFDLQQRELAPGGLRSEGVTGEDYADLRPSDTAPAGLGRLFPGALWYVGSFYLATDKPVVAAARTYPGKWYTEQWLYVDTDADGRLDDERKLQGVLQPTVEIEPGLVWWPTFDWPAVTATVVSREGARRQLEIHSSGYVLGPERNLIVLVPILGHEYMATGSIAGQDFELHLTDYDGDGRLSTENWSEDRALLRLPSSGKAPWLFQAPKLRPLLGIGSQLLSLQVDLSRPAVGLKPYDEPTNTFNLTATDGHGRPMRVAYVEVHPLARGSIIHWAPADSIDIPVQKEMPEGHVLMLGVRASWRVMEYELYYPAEPERHWRFRAMLDDAMLAGQHDPQQMPLGGPLHLTPTLTARPRYGPVTLTGVPDRDMLIGFGLCGVPDGAAVTVRAWILGPDGKVLARGAAEAPGLGLTISAKLGPDSPRGKCALNVVFDPGEYQDPIRATAHRDW